MDGLRPDAIGERETPVLFRMTQTGSYSLTARTIMPSNTLPSHTSMLTGESPERHHVSWNNVPAAKFDTVEVPTIFGVARARGYRTAAFFSKAKFHTLQRVGTLDYSQAPGGWFGKWASDRTVSDVERYLDESRPNLLFVHLSDPDTAGHDKGWMSDEYRRAVAAADAAVGRLVVAAEAAYGPRNYSVIVSADHGGHDRGHGTDDPRDVTIPWIAWGKGVRTDAPDQHRHPHDGHGVDGPLDAWPSRTDRLARRARPRSVQPASGRARHDTRGAPGNTVGSPTCRHARSTRRSPRDRRFRR